MIINQTVSGGGSSAPEHYIQKSVVNGVLKSSGSMPTIDLTGVTIIDTRQLVSAYEGNTTVSGTALRNANSLQTIREEGLLYAFNGCTNITATGLDNVQFLNFQSLKKAFANTAITRTGLSNLLSLMTGNELDGAFMNCRALTNIDIDNLVDITTSSPFNETFHGCTSLVTATFTSLGAIQGDYVFYNTFLDCSSLTTVSFPVLGYVTSGEGTWDDATVFEDMLRGCSGVTVHFPANLQSYIGGWTDVVNGFGGTNTTVLFDLPDVDLGYPIEPEEPEPEPEPEPEDEPIE